MGEIRKQLTENRAVSEMNFNAELLNFRCECSPVVRSVGRYSHGGAVMGGREYPKSGVTKLDISVKDALDVLELSNSERVEWLDDNWMDLSDQYGFRHFSPKSNVYIDLIVTVEFEIEYNSDVLYVTKEFNLKSEYSCPLLESGVGSNVTVEEVKDDKVRISVNDVTTEYNHTRLDKTRQDDFEKFLLDFLSHSGKWVTQEFGMFTELEDTLILPIKGSTYDFELKFTEPFNDSNLIWSIADEFGYDDPWNLERESCDVSPHSSARSGVRQKFVRIKNPDSEVVEDSRSLLSRIQEGFYTFW